ncbi:MAG: acyl carrier protein [Pseudomonadota bacterium]
MQAKILNFIQTELNEDENLEEVDSDSELLLDGIVDSMGIMRLVEFLEEQTNLRIPAEHITIENFRTINHIDAYVLARKEAGE